MTPSRHGFTLVEALVAIVFIIFATFIFAQLFKGIADTTRDSERTHGRIITFDRFAHALRRDVWNSYDMRAGDERTLVIHQASERMISWRFDPGTRAAIRTETQPRHTEQRTAFTDLPADVNFTVDGSALMLSLGKTLDQQGDTMRFESELRLVKGIAQ